MRDSGLLPRNGNALRLPVAHKVAHLRGLPLEALRDRGYQCRLRARLLLPLNTTISFSKLQFDAETFMISVEDGLQFPSFQAIDLEFLQTHLLR
jgi:hypothetical protein